MGPGRHWKLREPVLSRASGPDPAVRGPLVLFDVDGTLMDGMGLIVATMAEAFAAAGAVPPAASRINATIGLSLPEMVETLAAGLPQDLRGKILNGYRLRYFDVLEQDEMPPVYPGADLALRRLARRGFALGITTGKARRSTDHLLQAMGWGGLFQTVQCADDNPSKPSPVMVRRAQAQAGRGTTETILVGDSRHDMQMAAAAGIPAIFVSWGYGAPEELLAEGASAIAGDFGHLVDLLAGMRVGHRGGTA